MVKKAAVLDDKLHWYKDAIIYELHIKAFKDSNGDGVGDFGGLMQQLDYLQELGVTAIWVLPFYPSPLRDDGYDIADYYSINPTYGTLEDFQLFLNEAHKRNLKVITELVINHTSDQHPWFQRARRAPKGSPERDFYVWSDDPTKYKDVRIIFQDFEASNWTWDNVAQQYYWHRFFHHQPDLNYDNPLVQEEIFKIVDYWCAMGVDGFRLDAVPYLYEREGTNGENLPETHAFLKKLRTHIDQTFPGTVFLAEANMWPEDSASYFGDGDECHMNYHFPVMPRMFMALQMEDRYPVTDIFDQTPDIPQTCQWAMFLRNHDELTLEMVTDEERDYMYKAYAKDPKARINLGIRHRLAPLMDNNRLKIELLNSLLFSLPGTPVIYYGDEIGMGDNFYLGDRDGVRTPMQWSPDRNAGFSTANPHQLYLPVILDPEYSYGSVNVETQRRNTSSLFWYMKRMINMRKKYKAFGRGDLQFLNVENPKVLAFTRTYEVETLLIVVNLSKYAQAAEIDLAHFKGYQPVEMFSRNKFPLIKEESPYFFTLSPHSFQWFVLHKQQEAIITDQAVPLLNSNPDGSLLTETVRAQLENEILPAYLLKTTWFVGKKKSIYSLNIVRNSIIELAENPVHLLLLEVAYASGLPELYQLPLTIIDGKGASTIATNCPQAVVAQVQTANGDGVLCDALFTGSFQQWLLQQMAGNNTFRADNGSIQFYGSPGLLQHLQQDKEARARVHTSERANTAINYDNQFFLKLFRKVDRTPNPDLEISRYLSQEAGFPYTPSYIGTIEWRGHKETITLGMMQELVENHGDGYSYMLERINNYIERILARDRQTLRPEERIGTLSSPAGFEELPEELQVLLGGNASDQARQIGIRTGQMHLALAAAKGNKDFEPEDFSLHYQRSLFSSMQSLVRESYQSQHRNLNRVPEGLREEVAALFRRRDEILTTLKRIYNKKLDVVKTRIHGNYHLHSVLLTGRDIAIHEFSGNPEKSFSERRLKRSPLRDVATMILSLHDVAHEGFITTSQVQHEELQTLMPFANMWAHYMSGFFVKAYLETVQDSQFIPHTKEDLDVMLQTYMLERALKDLIVELDTRPEWAQVPLRIIQSILPN